jgi:hypothetical protein
MTTAEMPELTDILNRVTTWPTTLRITLARKILESLEKTEAPAASTPSSTRGFSTDEVRTLLKAIRSAGDDETGKPSVGNATHPAAQPPRTGSLKDLLGILRTDTPPPTDEECQVILEAELIKKHLK